MNLAFEKSCLIIKTIYELKGKKKIKIFDEDFVLKMLNNIINYKMIINKKSMWNNWWIWNIW